MAMATISDRIETPAVGFPASDHRADASRALSAAARRSEHGAGGFTVAAADIFTGLPSTDSGCASDGSAKATHRKERHTHHRIFISRVFPVTNAMMISPMRFAMTQWSQA